MLCPTPESLVVEDSFEDPYLSIGHPTSHTRHLDATRLDLGASQ